MRHLKSEKFFKWVRKDVFKINKPFALGFDEWDDWYNDLKKTNPVGYFFTESIPDTIDSLIRKCTAPYRDVRSYCRNRFVDKLQYLPTYLESGSWQEFETRLLFGMFGAFKDFVECELAYFSLIMADKDTCKQYNLTGWSKFKKFGFSKWRSSEVALKYLDMYTNEVYQDEEWLSDKSLIGKPTESAIKYTQVKDLYLWWTVTRPNREDSSKDLLEFFGDMREKYGTEGRSIFGLHKKYNKEEKNRYNLAKKKQKTLDKKYLDEDTKMMYALVNIRQFLWT